MKLASIVGDFNEIASAMIYDTLDHADSGAVDMKNVQTLKITVVELIIIGCGKCRTWNKELCAAKRLGCVSISNTFGFDDNPTLGWPNNVECKQALSAPIKYRPVGCNIFRVFGEAFQPECTANAMCCRNRSHAHPFFLAFCGHRQKSACRLRPALSRGGNILK